MSSQIRYVVARARDTEIESRRCIGSGRGVYETYWIRDNGRLDDTAEAVKYCLKGEDLEHLLAAPDNFVRFAAVVSGTASKRGPKLVQPMGAFRQWRAALEEQGMRTVWDPRSQSVVVVERRKRPAKAAEPEAADRVDPETGEVLPAPQEEAAPRNVLRGLMWCRASLPWATPPALVAGSSPALIHL